MEKYIDICIQPIPKKHLAKYRKSTLTIGKILVEHGAIASKDFVGEDKRVTNLKSPFAKLAKLKKGEVLIYAVAEFKSKAHCNQVMKRMMKDSRMQDFNMNPVFIDPKRVIMGGFKLIVGVQS
jgi:uncharacterized protein YbaA (DUF1428 family)